MGANYPIDVDTKELVPRDMMMRLTVDRYGNRFKPVYVIWRKLRTYTLVPQQCNAPTRSSILHTAITKAFNEAFASTMRQQRGRNYVAPAENEMRPSTESVAGNPCDDDTRSTEDDNGDTSTETTHPNPDPPSTASTDQEVMGAGEDIRSIPSRLEGVQIGHQAKKEVGTHLG
ncbi:hypothetical protein PPTG_22845 [Phytophthora nicotianae INRA-310]|uniref:Uncharacterized protein n=1 Tax=Phytophthora nicotianae (strain INRA-310) TaxID=761204 RepID=W2Q9M9_PHYN3|nr:hypothetical protein PPTG_22845 [Phytophthora nicotianae INRA-310]ETN09852.1 hypothetical protein PPTG_22845 [Phytophthora nicotianae INRA-310]